MTAKELRDELDSAMADGMLPPDAKVFVSVEFSLDGQDTSRIGELEEFFMVRNQQVFLHAKENP